MHRRASTILILLAFLVVGTGAADLLHTEHDHGTAGSHDCQICYFLKLATGAVIALVIIAYCLPGPRLGRPAIQESSPLLRRHLSPAAPRAPPGR